MCGDAVTFDEDQHAQGRAEQQHRGHGLLGLHDREQRRRQKEGEAEAARGLHGGPGERRERGEQHQPRVTRPLGKPVSIRGSASFTITRSSIRTPNSPGTYTPGSTVTALTASSDPSAVLPSRGPSWISSPTPCPSPWPKCSSWPAASIGSRATASTALHSAPATVAATASSCTCRTRS